MKCLSLKCTINTSFLIHYSAIPGLTHTKYTIVKAIGYMTTYAILIVITYSNAEIIQSG